MIKEKVRWLVEQYGTREPLELAKHLNIMVNFRPLGELNSYFLSSNGINIVTINSNLPRQVQSFTLACEIGYLQSCHESNSFILRDTFFHAAAHEDETETIKFALYLLLSDKQIQDNPEYTAATWAEIYGLPIDLMELRFQMR